MIIASDEENPTKPTKPIRRTDELERTMFLLIVALVVVVPLAELYVIVNVGSSIGVLPTVVLLLAISMIGSAIVKYEGLRVWTRFMSQVRSGAVPEREIIEGACILAAGVFLLAPGFVSDVVGIILLLPPTRALAVRIVSRRLGRSTRVIRATYDGRIVDVTDIRDASPDDSSSNGPRGELEE